MIVNNLSHDTEQVPPDPNGLWKPKDRYAYSYTEMFPDPFQLANLEITTNNRTTLPGKWVLREYDYGYFHGFVPVEASDDILVLRKVGESLYKSRIPDAIKKCKTNMESFIEKEKGRLKDMEKQREI